MSFEDVVFILDGPIVRRGDDEQHLAAWKASRARHVRLNSPQLVEVEIPVNSTLEPDSDAVMDDDDTNVGGSHKRNLSQAFSRADISEDLPDQRRVRVTLRLMPDPPAAPHDTAIQLSATSFTGSGGPCVVETRRSSFVSLRRMPVQADVERIRPPPSLNKLQRGVTRAEQASVQSLDQNVDGIATDVIYTLPLVLTSGHHETSDDLMPFVGTEYHLAADTADSSFWAFGEGFQRLRKLEKGGPNQFAIEPWGSPDIPDGKNVLPLGPRLYSVGRAKRYYGDGGAVYLSMWRQSYDFHFFAATWNWKTNSEHRQIKIRLPRILATSANDITVGQPAHGNLGLAVPGWRGPWDDVDECDRVTFFDVLQNKDAVVETPKQLTTRLMFPNGEAQARAGPNVRSFLYYGHGSPCGKIVKDTLLLPTYGPRLYIFPDLMDPTWYKFWSLQFLSISLMRPRMGVTHPNLETEDPTEWTIERIAMPNPLPVTSPGPGGLPPPGIRVIFDSCSSCSLLPVDVLRKIWVQWFDQDRIMFPQEGREIKRLWHDDPEKFTGCDIIFEFMDARGTRFDLRTSASEFLTSPWKGPTDDTRWSQLNGEDVERGKVHSKTWLLGMNFFWTSFLKLSSEHVGSRPIPGKANPYIQFAPQRVVRKGREVASMWDLAFHKDLPPRLLAQSRRQPEVYSDS